MARRHDHLAGHRAGAGAAPIPTADWTLEELDDRVAEVREQYVEALGNWSGREERPVVATEHSDEDGAGAGAPPDAPLDWGTSAQMNPLETAMWRAEASDPRLRANVTLLELLDPAPDWERLRAAHEWASRMVPRMRQRVVEPALGVGAPRWVTVPELDLDRHVRRVRLEEPGTMRQLLDVVGEFASAALDRDRPLWEVLFVEGLADGRAGYVVKTHHSTTDGLGAVQLMSRLHSRTAEHDPTRPEPPVPVADDASPVALLTDQLAGTVRAAPLAALRRGADAVGLLQSPRAAASQALDLVRSASRTLAPSRAGSGLLSERGGGWHFEVLDVPLGPLKAGSRTAGGSLNDGFLAAVLGGFRRYSRAARRPRRNADPGHPDQPAQPGRSPGRQPVHRGPLPGVAGGDRSGRPVRSIREFVISARETAGTGVVNDLLAPALGWFPAPVIGAVSGWLTSANDVQVSNLPGGTEPLYIAGSRITRMYPFGPLPGCGAMITLLSHEDQCCIGLNLDAAAVTDPDGLVSDLRAGLDEVIALAG